MLYSSFLFLESPPPGYMSEDGDSQAVGMYVPICSKNYI